MTFATQLEEGLLLRRYKRFLADIQWQDQLIQAHVANTGSLLGVLNGTATPCRFTLSDDPARKLKASLQMIKTETSWVGINTQLPNRLVHEAFSEGRIPHWKAFSAIKVEYKLNKQTRLDMVLFTSGKPKTPAHYVEIKNVTYARNSIALFPDAVTERGRKHMDELQNLCEEGHSCELVFVVQRTDCDQFEIAKDIDPEYAQAFTKATRAGLKTTVYPVKFFSNRVELDTSRELLLRI